MGEAFAPARRPRHARPLLACAAREIEGDVTGECTDRADNDADGAYDCRDEEWAASPDCYKPDRDTDADTDADTDSDTDTDAFAEDPRTGDTVDAWEPAPFTDRSELSGREGWRSDDDGGTWGSGGATDDWLLNDGFGFADGGIRAQFFTQDDDTLGLALMAEDGTLYLFLLCGAEDRASPASCPVELDGGVGSALVEVTDRSATVLADSSRSYTFGGPIADPTLSLDGGELVGTSVEYDVELRASVAASPIRKAGFYAYDAGGQAADLLTGFADPVWFQFDDDADGVVNDDDKCPQDADR